MLVSPLTEDDASSGIEDVVPRVKILLVNIRIPTKVFIRVQNYSNNICTAYFNSREKNIFINLVICNLLSKIRIMIKSKNIIRIFVVSVTEGAYIKMLKKI